MSYTEVNCIMNYIEFNCINILIMYPWVVLTIVQLTQKQPTFEILLSQIEFF